MDKPFDPKVLKAAKDLAAKYRLILEPDEDVGFIGRAVEMPLVMGDGTTPDACVRETREALVAAIATAIEMGERPPPPAAENPWREQIHIRVTAEEKLLLEEAARQRVSRCF